MICPACNKKIGNFHKTPNGFHRDCFAKWVKGYNTAMTFCNSELKFAGIDSIGVLYRKRCSIKKQGV